MSDSVYVDIKSKWWVPPSLLDGSTPCLDPNISSGLQYVASPLQETSSFKLRGSSISLSGYTWSDANSSLSFLFAFHPANAEMDISRGTVTGSWASKCVPFSATATALDPSQSVILSLHMSPGDVQAHELIIFSGAVAVPPGAPSATSPFAVGVTAPTSPSASGSHAIEPQAPTRTGASDPSSTTSGASGSTLQSVPMASSHKPKALATVQLAVEILLPALLFLSLAVGVIWAMRRRRHRDTVVIAYQRHAVPDGGDPPKRGLKPSAAHFVGSAAALGAATTGTTLSGPIILAQSHPSAAGVNDSLPPAYTAHGSR